MSSFQMCQAHQRNKEYVCIDQLNTFYFFCEECEEYQDSKQTQDRKKVFSIQDLYCQVKQRKKNLYEQMGKLNQLEQDFKQFTDNTKQQISNNHYQILQIKQQLETLSDYFDNKVMSELLENPLFQQFINDEINQNENDLYNILGSEFKQFSRQMLNNMEIKQNDNNNTLQSKNQNGNNSNENQTLIQNNQYIKKTIKSNKSQNAQNQIMQKQINNQFEEQEELINKQSEQIKPSQQKIQCENIITIESTNNGKNIIPIESNNQGLNTPQNESINQGRVIMNKFRYKIEVLAWKIRKVLIIDNNWVMVASKKRVAIVHNQTDIKKQAFQEKIIDIHYLEQEEIMIQFQDKLQFFDLKCSRQVFLQLKYEIAIQLIKNKFAYKQGVLYHFNDYNNQLKKQTSTSTNVFLIEKEIKLKDNVVAIKIVDDKVYIGYINGLVKRFDLNLVEDINFRVQLSKIDQEKFRLFYFEQDYCIGIQEKNVYLKFYNVDQEVQFSTQYLILDCSYIIDYEKKQIEIECLEDTIEKVFIFKLKNNELLRSNEVKYQHVSSLQSCPISKKFYYGKTNGKLKCVKQSI